MRVSHTTPDDFLARLEDDGVREAMYALDTAITTSMPGRRRVLYEGTFWGGTDQHIIGYGTMVQTRPKDDDVIWFVVGLARQKANFSIYVNAVKDGAYLGHAYRDRLGKVKLGAASIGFRKLDDIDLEAIQEMVAEAHSTTPPDAPLRAQPKP